MSKNLNVEGRKLGQFMAYRFFCNDNQECRRAEKILRKADINFVKIPSKNQSIPMLITSQQICRGLDDIDRFTTAVIAIREKYSIDWS